MLKIILLTLSLLTMGFSGQVVAGFSPVKLVVLCYHHVDNPRAKLYNVTSEQLFAQITAMKTAGFVFVSMADVSKHFLQGETLPSRSALITFDDGAHNTFTVAWPILKKLGVPFGIFVYPTAISVGHRQGFMEWDEVRAMSKAGVEVGAHGFDHPFLPFPPKTVKTRSQFDAWLFQETSGAKQYIEKQISCSVTTIALPFGLEDVASYFAIKKAGYQLAFNISGMTNDDRVDPRYLNRVMVVDTDTPQSVVRRAQTLPLILKERFPHSLSTVSVPTAQIHFVLSEQDNVATRSLRVYLSSKGAGPSGYDERKGYSWIVELPKEQVYTVTVLATNKDKESCFGSWSFIKSKNTSY